jgi:unsaturated rhamnogalacturonyl hydrolase
MMINLKKLVLFYAILAPFSIFQSGCKKLEIMSPLDQINKVAERVISETVFGFQAVEKGETHGLQFLDFSAQRPASDSYSFYAVSSVYSETDTTFSIGISYAEEVTVWVDGEKVFYGDRKKVLIFREYTYDRFYFDDHFSLRLTPGYHTMLVKINSWSERCLLLMHPVDEWGNQNHSVKFTLEKLAPSIRNTRWLALGPVDPKKPFLSVENFMQDRDLPLHFELDNEIYTWELPYTALLKGFIIPENAAFTRESYADWHYAIGAMNMILLELSRETGKSEYVNFVRSYNDFVIDNYEYLKYEYNELFAIRGSYHRIFRACMLDDCGAPALSMLQMDLDSDMQDYEEMISRMAAFVMDEQERLPDGTFCRPEPYPNTVWADDLFMSVPFLLRYASFTKNTDIYDDIALQIRHFNNYLYNNETGVYKHGYFADRSETSIAHWARANGWVAWAVSEALLYMPPDHEAYQEILNIFRIHMHGLQQYQHRSGLWHQVIDRPDSYLETSASAMFVLAMSRGVRKGWLDESYRSTALKGWKGISSKISDEGVVGRDLQGNSHRGDFGVLF